MVVMLRTSRLSLAASALVVTTALTACGSGSSNSGSVDKVETVASFYTLQYALERIGPEPAPTTAEARTMRSRMYARIQKPA